MKFRFGGKCILYGFLLLSVYCVWVWYWIQGIESYPIPAYARRVKHKNELLEPQRKRWAEGREKAAKARARHQFDDDDAPQKVS